MRLYWWKVITRFTGRWDIGEKLASHIKTVPWINITTAKNLIKWNIFRLNKSLRKSAWLFEKHKKIKITSPFSTCMLVTVWCAEMSYCTVSKFLDGSAARLTLASIHSLLITVLIFIRIIIITSACVKRKINRAGVESFQFPCKSLP